jgi:hypothetical protein
MIKRRNFITYSVTYTGTKLVTGWTQFFIRGVGWRTVCWNFSFNDRLPNARLHKSDVWNWITETKSCPSATLSTTNTTRPSPYRTQAPTHSEKLVAKCQSYWTVKESIHADCRKGQDTASTAIQEPESNNVQNCVISIMIFTLHKICLWWSRIRWTGHATGMEGDAKWITAATETSVNGDSGAEVTIILKHILEKQCVRVWTIHTVQDGNRWWVLANTLMKIRVS